MTITIDLKDIDPYSLFKEAIESPFSSDLIVELRRFFRNQIEKKFVHTGIKVIYLEEEFISQKLLAQKNVELQPIHSLHGEPLDIKFCAGYGAAEESHSAINYQHGFYKALPLLQSFKDCINFSIGNMLFLTENIDADVMISPSEDIRIVGYSFDISKKKRKSFFVIFGIHFSSVVINEIFTHYKNVSDNELLEIRISETVRYPVLFASKLKSEFFTCSCFKGYVNWEKEVINHLYGLQYYPQIKTKIESVKYLDGICHLCTKSIPSFIYGNAMYYNGFLQLYLPYQQLEYKKRFGNLFGSTKSINEEIENQLRIRLGFPRIGEKWISETTLFKIVQEIFSEFESVFHYRGKELQGLELDIWIPHLKLGIEYQGEQHYSEIEHWGGEQGLKKRITNDQRKREICNNLKYRLIEIHHSEELNRDMIYKKLRELNIIIA